ncbi:hypothetical protein MUK42_36796 [Musa troglodytarum]|uniref:Uncharacterized protein n=1 Tax=Musa troglodytarum TaxID=320322 RepID=A0A9E7K0D4_9LILI|nr:hypothetical protein MUK42_36796 [Musa troglodytarum]
MHSPPSALVSSWTSQSPEGFKFPSLAPSNSVSRSIKMWSSYGMVPTRQLGSTSLMQIPADLRVVMLLCLDITTLPTLLSLLCTSLSISMIGIDNLWQREVEWDGVSEFNTESAGTPQLQAPSRVMGTGSIKFPDISATKIKLGNNLRIDGFGGEDICKSTPKLQSLEVFVD